ncbi:hypothetical protein [Legionella micdadei]|uniref:Uncharacterized protein n=1 Tax=Legionella micdadei TaxID=451 RepID=A0A098GJH6_LEGMI|nr:hypothetical protein [Legionella micdadei]ARG98572.1 hypothetical protein B6N58_13400 [Legionella micdadei]ARH01316.1 hypothetical protein B6V88_13410 [Legionella micdadei]KTD27432.1 hypothetical protein Lmic_2367 [Legionella micdadei]NSL19358.1 hypothetical protein [Legionella micdadei]CEG62140.1 protein of unknown function [Legionella micdadei]
MATSEDTVRAELKRAHANERGSSPERAKKRRALDSFNIVELCDAAAQITKMLLGLGAENNWSDVKESQGLSMMAGMYRGNWLYLSQVDRGEDEEPPKIKNKANWFKTFKSGTPQTFFFYTPKTESRKHRSYVERNAAAAVLSLTGSCDQHAFVLATLLRAILPVGTVINICGLNVAGETIPHTFVVVGSIGRKNIRLRDLPLHKLLAVDAWTIIGGAVELKDYFLCEGIIRDGFLVVDQSYLADGQDHLIKRVSKQKILLDIIKEGHSGIRVKSSSYLSSFIHHDLIEQINYTKVIKRDKFLSDLPDDYDGMFHGETVSATYQPPIRSNQALEYICRTYPHKKFNRCLEYVNEQVESIINEEKKSDADYTQSLAPTL